MAVEIYNETSMHGGDLSAYNGANKAVDRSDEKANLSGLDEAFAGTPFFAVVDWSTMKAGAPDSPCPSLSTMSCGSSARSTPMLLSPDLGGDVAMGDIMNSPSPVDERSPLGQSILRAPLRTAMELPAFEDDAAEEGEVEHIKMLKEESAEATYLGFGLDSSSMLFEGFAEDDQALLPALEEAFIGSLSMPW